MTHEVKCVTSPDECDLEDAEMWNQAKRIANKHRAETGHGVVIKPKQ